MVTDSFGNRSTGALRPGQILSHSHANGETSVQRTDFSDFKNKNQSRTLAACVRSYLNSATAAISEVRSG